MDGLPHLSRRFLRGLRARPLGPAEQRAVAGLLRGGESRLFFRQEPRDQRHALACARAVLAQAPRRADLARAALLHDVGKADSRLGVAGRVLATLLALLRLPAPGRLGVYLDHGPRGAQELGPAGADELSVAYARHHHGARPSAISRDDWELLARADRV